MSEFIENCRTFLAKTAVRCTVDLPTVSNLPWQPIGPLKMKTILKQSVGPFQWLLPLSIINTSQLQFVYRVVCLKVGL
jgi:hypothetical protein